MSWSGPITIDANGDYGLQAVACRYTSQCTAVDGAGQEVTFNPASPGKPRAVTIDPAGGGLTGVTCWSSTGCAAVDAAGQEVTFDPTSPAAGPRSRSIHTAASQGLRVQLPVGA